MPWWRKLHSLWEVGCYICQVLALLRFANTVNQTLKVPCKDVRMQLQKLILSKMSNSLCTRASSPSFPVLSGTVVPKLVGELKHRCKETDKPKKYGMLQIYHKRWEHTQTHIGWVIIPSPLNKASFRTESTHAHTAFFLSGRMDVSHIRILGH